MNDSLSNRLLACAGFVHPGDRVADIGCDHGYLGIYLLKQGIARSVIAADINRLPLESARSNARKFGCLDQMCFYLSDGLRNVPADFDTCVCAGVGADTMISILSAAPWLKNPRYRMILQCQSKIAALRRYLSQEGYHILRETLAQDGKFIYPVMEIVYQPGHALTEAQCWLSPALLECGSRLLPAYADRIVGNVRLSADGMRRSGSPDWEAQNRLLTQLEELKGRIAL